MTEAKIKEQMAYHFFGALASRAGYLLTKPFVDEGVDGLMQSAETYVGKNRTRQIWGGYSIGIQFKTTTSSRVLTTPTGIRYDCDVKNFNDLIYRKNKSLETNFIAMPLILVLLVLDQDEKNWLTVNLESDRSCLNGKFYWYYPSPDETFSEKKYAQRLRIPKENSVDLNFFKNIFNLFFQNIN